MVKCPYCNEDPFKTNVRTDEKIANYEQVDVNGKKVKVIICRECDAALGFVNLNQ